MCNKPFVICLNIVNLCYTIIMDKLLIKYRFQNFPYIVVDGKGVFYQLPSCEHKYTRAFRKLNRVLNNGVTEGYRIDRKFVSLKQLRAQAYLSSEIIILNSDNIDPPF